MEKGWRKRFNGIKNSIMSGYRRGVCDLDGRTVKTESGRPIARPKAMGYSRTLCNRCKQWYRTKEGHTCDN